MPGAATVLPCRDFFASCFGVHPHLPSFEIPCLIIACTVFLYWFFGVTPRCPPGQGRHESGTLLLHPVTAAFLPPDDGRPACASQPCGRRWHPPRARPPTHPTPRTNLRTATEHDTSRARPQKLYPMLPQSHSIHGAAASRHPLQRTSGQG